MIKYFTKDAVKTKQETLCVVAITIFPQVSHHFENFVVLTALFRTQKNWKIVTFILEGAI